MLKKYPELYFVIALGLGHQVFQKLFKYNSVFVDSYLDDLIGVPFLLGITQIIEKELFSTNPSEFHSFSKIIFVTIAWSVCFEFILPKVDIQYTADVADVLCYFAGAIVYMLIQYRMKKRSLILLAS